MIDHKRIREQVLDQIMELFYYSDENEACKILCKLVDG